ncbi:MAG TPA: lytic transglycosylase domain-containing protein [Anaeromyxobacter sp.]|nr:lytic transglycosylase domain-containing protein [Anaeromyxobacter sp.]
MRVLPLLVTCALLGSFAALPARAGELYSYVDDDGVQHFSNAPSDSRYHRVHGHVTPGGVYRSDTPDPGRAKAVARTGAPSLERYREHIKSAAKKYQIPEELLLAVMAVESNFDPLALSEKGAVGLMQLMPDTARDMYAADAWSPEQNIEAGARYLRILANQYNGDLIKTLAAYNAGPEAVRRAGEAVPDIPETREYVSKVLALYKAYKAGR